MPETEENLKLDPPLYERISVKLTLNPLDLESTIGYINHRIKIAGREEPLFSEGALKLIHTFSKGKPRLINTICDNALLEAFIEKKQFIDEDIIKQISSDMGLK
jgi:type II secretory pathway predicted ATPase ExeA